MGMRTLAYLTECQKGEMRAVYRSSCTNLYCPTSPWIVGNAFDVPLYSPIPGCNILVGGVFRPTVAHSLLSAYLSLRRHVVMFVRWWNAHMRDSSINVAWCLRSGFLKYFVHVQSPPQWLVLTSVLGSREYMVWSIHSFCLAVHPHNFSSAGLSCIGLSVDPQT